jgi:hypothetical protein
MNEGCTLCGKFINSLTHLLMTGQSPTISMGPGMNPSWMMRTWPKSCICICKVVGNMSLSVNSLNTWTDQR